MSAVTHSSSESSSPAGVSDFLSTKMKTVRPRRLEAPNSDALPIVHEFRHERRREVHKMRHSVTIATHRHKGNKSLMHIRRQRYAILRADMNEEFDTDRHLYAPDQRNVRDIQFWSLILRLVQHYKWLYLHLLTIFTTTRFGR